MLRRLRNSLLVWGLAALGAALAMPVHGAGFSIFEQGSKAMGMAGAFTAQADDGSAMFHNVAGLAFQKEKRHELGLTIIHPIDVSFDGASPFPGEGVTASAEEPYFTPPHYYYVRPVGERWTFGFGFSSPFGLSVEWQDRVNWPGRFISARSELTSFDFNPSIGWQVTDNFGVGFGVIMRFSEVQLLRHVPVINPFTQSVFDAATVELTSDYDNDFGFNFGLLHKVNDRFSWGLSYRSKIEIEYSGDAVFKQISSGSAALDAVVAQTIPFDQKLPVRTLIDFPDTASFGMAFGLTKSLLLEVDANWTGWDSFDALPLIFIENDEFSDLIPQEYQNSYHYRVGLNIDVGDNQWRFGYVYDESPQPGESVGPILPDANRNGFTLGFGWRDRLDLAFMYLPFLERTTLTNRDNFFGSYETTALLFGATWKL